MKTVRLGDLVLGEGIPKICVPFVGKNERELMEEAALCGESPADLAEWRADWLEGLTEGAGEGHIAGRKRAADVAAQLRDRLGGRPLLFTYRRRAEGGNGDASLPVYENLIGEIIEERAAQAVDVELSAGEEAVWRLTQKARSRDVRVILSKHDFSKTLSKEEMLDSLKRMEALGADVAKIAVMPHSKKDVLTLLAATAEASERLTVPVITMSMGGQGLVSRLSGEVFGSCLTFGALRSASAPGQIDAGDLKRVLEVIHQAL